MVTTLRHGSRDVHQVFKLFSGDLVIHIPVGGTGDADVPGTSTRPVLVPGRVGLRLPAGTLGTRQARSLSPGPVRKVSTSHLVPGSSLPNGVVLAGRASTVELAETTLQVLAGGA